MAFMTLFMYGCGIIVGLLITFAIMYFFVRAAVKDGYMMAVKEMAEKEKKA